MLEIYTAARADPLVHALEQRLAIPLADPFTPELVAVPTHGIERWITQRLADELGARQGHFDGVCANVDFPSPGRLLGEAVALASGLDPRGDPWRPQRLLWSLLEAVDGALEEPWLAPLARHFAAHPERRVQRARALARLFDEYGSYRPQMIQAWARGEGEHWQAQLWRRLRETVGLPSPAERLPAACARLRAEPELLSLPPRLAVFGLTRMPAAQLQVLIAIAAHRDVQLMLPRAFEGDLSRLRNPLLISWGREHRGFWEQLISSLEASEPPQEVHRNAPDVADHQRRGTLLQAVQHDIASDRRPPGVPLPGERDLRIELSAEDRSIRIHACHGRARQVEVLREAILHRLADDPTLEPRDVIIMCPDVEAFAPLIEATFGGGQDAAVGDSHAQLRVRIADRSLRQTNPMLSFSTRLLELAGGRVSASEVLDLADSAPVRRRFRFDDDDLAQIREWVAAAAIHWGLDAGARAPYRLEQVESGTWAAGLRRLLLGVAFEGDGQTLFSEVLPLTGVPSGAIDLVGRFTELIDRLDAALRSLSGSRGVRDWAAALAAAADTLTATPEHEPWQRRELDLILADVVEAAPESGAFAQLALPDIRALLGHRLEGRPTRANFGTGHLTVCAMAPMRTVPHRIVCLLGLDDGVFPRQEPHDGDNLLLRDPRPGDRDARAEDRQLLLDALLAARGALIITYTGNDERTNAPRPPAVPVGELLDVIDATARWDGGGESAGSGAGEGTEPGTGGGPRRAREAVLVRHPLQAFDPRNFTVGRGCSPAGEHPWSFDRAALEGAQALTRPRTASPPLLEGPLPAARGEDAVALDDLVRFVQRPVRAFLRQRLGISLLAPEDEVRDSLPTQLDGLERWGVGQRLLEALLAGVDPRAAGLAEIARGTLPPGALGEPVMREVLPVATQLARHALAHAGNREPRSLEANLTLADGTRLTGTVSGLHGHVLLAASYSRLNARHRLGAWVRLLALSAAHPELALEAVTVARAPVAASELDQDGASAVIVARLPQLGGDQRTRRAIALAELERLQALRAEGMREPLCLPCLSGAAYAAAALQTGEDPESAALRVWTSTYDRDGEDREPEHRQVLGGRLDLVTLAARALPLWQPLLAREVIERP